MLDCHDKRWFPSFFFFFSLLSDEGLTRKKLICKLILWRKVYFIYSTDKTKRSVLHSIRLGTVSFLCSLMDMFRYITSLVPPVSPNLYCLLPSSPPKHLSKYPAGNFPLSFIEIFKKLRKFDELFQNHAVIFINKIAGFSKFLKTLIVCKSKGNTNFRVFHVSLNVKVTCS